MLKKKGWLNGVFAKYNAIFNQQAFVEFLITEYIFFTSGLKYKSKFSLSTFLEEDECVLNNLVRPFVLGVRNSIIFLELPHSKATHKSLLSCTSVL